MACQFYWDIEKFKSQAKKSSKVIPSKSYRTPKVPYPKALLKVIQTWLFAVGVYSRGSHIGMVFVYVPALRGAFPWMLIKRSVGVHQKQSRKCYINWGYFEIIIPKTSNFEENKIKNKNKTALLDKSTSFGLCYINQQNLSVGPWVGTSFLYFILNFSLVVYIYRNCVNLTCLGIATSSSHTLLNRHTYTNTLIQYHTQ